MSGITTGSPEYAGFWIRVAAALIDTVVMVAVTLPMLVAVYGWSYFDASRTDSVAGVADFLLTWVAPAAAVVGFWLWRQATPGKMVLALRVVDAATGDTMTVRQSVGRYLGYFVSTIPLGLGLIAIAFDPKKQGWHDKLAGTVVVRSGSRAASRLLLVAAAYAVALVVFRRAVEFSFTSPWSVLIAMVCFLGLVDSARPLFLLRMPRWLRQVRAWEGKGTVYRALGVPAFGVLLRRTPLRALNREVYLRRRPGDRARVVVQLEAAEAAHALDALLVIPYMAYAGTQHWWNVVFWFTLAQTVVNLYPVMHLRWARGRLIEHSGGKSAQNTA